jgi:PAS domain S-box-containing protein
VVKVNGIAHDITALKQAERELRLAQFSLERASIGILRIDKEAQILSVNDRFCKNLGYTREELCTMTILDINPTFSPDGWKKHVKNFIGVPDPKTFETMHRRKDGTQFPVEITVNYLNFQGTESFIIFVRNLTEQKQAEAEREKLQSQLHQAQKMEAVGQLAGGVAHDFNNILQAIIGYASLMKMKIGEDSELSSYVDQILSSSTKSANLTRQLLAFSRKQLIEMKPIDINDLIINIDKLLRRLIGEDIEFRTRVTDKALIVMADKGQIEQVLLNLATNARDAMPKGGLLTIETSAFSVDENHIKEGVFENPGRYAQITVSDNGLGMDEETEKKIFEPFYTTKEIGKGTGLGLAIVYGIIKQHDGEIQVNSELGKGSTFSIYLPLARVEKIDDEKRELPMPKGGTETILLAEDQEEVRIAVKMTLEEVGYRVIEAVDGDDAIEKFKGYKDTVHLLLTDVIMPKKSGKNVYDAVKALNPAVKALFFSGYASNIIQQRAMIDEGLNFVSKPVSPHDLLRKVRMTLDSNA